MVNLNLENQVSKRAESGKRLNLKAHSRMVEEKSRRSPRLNMIKKLEYKSIYLPRKT
jgi:hypothetical protein